jgi:hypothetical protein
MRQEMGGTTILPLCVALSLALLASGAGAQTTTERSSQTAASDVRFWNGHLAMPPAMERALRSWNAHFTTWTTENCTPAVRALALARGAPGEVPWAVRGDFNGDGVVDLALSGHDARKQYLIVLLSERKQYRLRVLQEDSYDAKQVLEFHVEEALSRAAPGTRYTCDGGTAVHLQFEGFQLQSPGEHAPTIWYWEGGRLTHALAGC